MWELSLEATYAPVVAALKGSGAGRGGGVVVRRTPVRPNSNSDEFRASVVLNYNCCGARIALVVGSLKACPILFQI